MSYQIQKIDETVMDSAAAVISKILSQAQTYIEDSKAENTKRAYRSDWKDFSAWCADYGYETLPASDDTFALYITSMALKGFKISTITRRISAISQAHQAAGYEVPTTQKVKLVMSGIRRRHGSKESGKQPILVDMIVKMCEYIPNNVKGIRDKALLLLGFAGAFRRSELVGIDYEHITFEPSGIIVHLSFSKTDQEGQGQTIGIPYGKNPSTCPVKTLIRWLEVSRIQRGPLFRRINRHGHISEDRLSDKSVSLIIKEYAKKSGYNEALFSGHSLRSGLATSAALAGKSERAIMAQTRHRSEKMVRRYIRMATVFEENAASDIGL